jgi:hypothetical protein
MLVTAKTLSDLAREMHVCDGAKLSQGDLFAVLSVGSEEAAEDYPCSAVTEQNC